MMCSRVQRAVLSMTRAVMVTVFAAGAATAIAEDVKMDVNRRVVKVAVCQTLCIDSDPSGNLRRIEHAMEEAARQKVQVACFPECAILGWVNPDAYTLADPIPGPTSDRLCALARQHKIMIAIGLDEKQGDKVYDAAILIGADGNILLKHRKINTLVELLTPPYTRGRAEEIKAVDTPIGRVGMLICADTFKEDLVRAAGRQSPDVLLVPYGWAADKEQWPDHGKSLTETVSRAAKWAGCPVVGTDCVGMISHGPWTGKTYGGQSVVADRQGKVLGVLRDRDVDLRVFEVRVGRK